MQKNLSIDYSKISVSMNSKGRLFKEQRSIYRNPYQRDRDRIIHSTAFRRLKHKTQVFVNTSKDHYRTRITHSLEVSQIARTLGKYFNLNEDLCETLSLSHDLGHTPFGHAGEEVLDECMSEFGGFDHNIQTIRIVTKIENKYYNYLGLNLCIETLDGLIKHNGPLQSSKKIDLILGKNYFKNKINFKNQPSLEAQIASISDDIAYNSHDLEDGLKANLFTINDLKYIPILSDIIKIHERKINKNNQDLFIRQVVREIIDVMVKDIINNIKKNIKKNKVKTINDIYKLNKPIVSFSNEMNIFNILIKNFLKKNMYLNKRILKKTNQGKKIIKTLFNHIIKNPNKFHLNGNFNKISKYRSVCDFIAGMTDRYAIELYKKVK
ncbi:MAG: deoxyguanosinetriphosphate triphosphohydrolase [Pelagibacteraceae bacterium TMED216]|nr:MAG: deoxyguanosinetriphosphate triphosphohydrolase [Pelagibacteraceae bacterium TMED216]